MEGRFRCGMSYPSGASGSQRTQMGFNASTIEDIAEMAARVTGGLQCEGGCVTLSVIDRQEAAAITIQRRSCHGFGEMVSRALTALEAPPVPEKMGSDARAEMFGKVG